jgi:hypothetical protein
MALMKKHFKVRMMLACTEKKLMNKTWNLMKTREIQKKTGNFNRKKNN